MSSFANLSQSSLPSPYLPHRAVITRTERVSAQEMLFVVEPDISPGHPLHFLPGQFFMVGLPGFGEAPISICAGDGVTFELCIRAVGNLTRAFHALGPGDAMTIRGPFGRGFDLSALKKHDILFIAGGIGMVPMRALVHAVLADRKSYGALTLMYGAKNPGELLFTGEMAGWGKKKLDVQMTIDTPAEGWDGNVGVITTLIQKAEVDSKNTVAAVIGPPVMYKFVAYELAKKRVTPGKIYVSLERRMKCGVGKCGHCQINCLYTCQEGPVFRLSELKGMHEAL